MVYVDDAVHRFGRMTMCHMIADSTAELLAMAAKIGVDRKWIQSPGTKREHFDVCKSKRELAVKAGAVAVTTRELVQIYSRREESTDAEHEVDH